MQLAQYELGRTIGRGTDCVVQLAVEPRSGRQWAVKALDKKGYDEARDGAALARAVGAVAQLRHRGVAHVHEALQSTPRLYIVMELVAGGSLAARVGALRKLDEAASRRYFRQLVSAVRYCHARGVAVGDIKPEGILMDAGRDAGAISKDTKKEKKTVVAFYYNGLNGLYEKKTHRFA
jgi:serine/threonine protein kinase